MENPTGIIEFRITNGIVLKSGEAASADSPVERIPLSDSTEQLGEPRLLDTLGPERDFRIAWQILAERQIGNWAPAASNVIVDELQAILPSRIGAAVPMGMLLDENVPYPAPLFRTLCVAFLSHPRVILDIDVRVGADT